MPFKRRVSQILKNKSTEDGTTHGRQDPRAPSLAEQSIPEEYEDERDYERDIYAIRIASLECEIARLESRSREQEIAIDHVKVQSRQETNVLRTTLDARLRENARLEGLLQEAHNARLKDHNTFSERLRDQLQETEDEKTQIQREKSQLQSENAALQTDCRALFQSNRQYEMSLSQKIAVHTEQNRRIQDLELRLSTALQPMDEESRQAYDARLSWAREKTDLQETLEAESTTRNQRIEELILEKEDLKARTDAERSTMTQQLRDISTEKNHLQHKFETERSEMTQRLQEMSGGLYHRDAKLKGLNSKLAAAKAALDDEKTAHQGAKDMIIALQTQEGVLQEQIDEALSTLEEAQSQLSNEMSKLSTIFTQSPTPRQLLLMKVVALRSPRNQDIPTAASPFSVTCEARHLRADDLDIPLSGANVDTFLGSICHGSAGDRLLQGLTVFACPECNKFKFTSTDEGCVVSESPRWFRQNKCPTCKLCTDCLKDKLLKAMKEDWWYELDSSRWLKCPVDACNTPLGIESVEALVEMLRDFSTSDVALLSGMYRRALVFREALARVNPRPELEAISTSIALHRQLTAFGICTDELNTVTANYNIEVGEVVVGSIDRSNLKVPIFSNFFRRSETAVDCSICVESFHEIAIESPERWTQACDGFQGAWMSEVFSFPKRDALHCDRDIDFCRGCLQRHLASQLEHFGRNAGGHLSCPSCRRVLSDSEIRSLASAETVQTYDHNLLLSHLSQELNFRYCLNSTCNSGQIYEQDEYPNPHISCGECEFEMCFTHQIPWHAGLSCDQYDSQREHGDADYRQTQDWMRTNSKECPGQGCNVNIEKGNACFHMTCTQCRHEFCWECLGDWTRINPRPGTYVKEAHNTGCWFRSSDVEPTQISGVDLREAIRRRGR